MRQARFTGYVLHLTSGGFVVPRWDSSVPVS